ncbi:RNA-binding protein 1 [Cyphomyrmex costatus]|uniref:RNA-binding protein 1 n=1 Tax=Cyphomyrmex costatus TaxID=456900 RepID=A0A195CRS2_9HYME|nr:RNA-binding protein 1 [Cyphomyrmex costatus]
MSRYREWDLSCKVYVGNLGSSASKHEIESAFSKYGPLRNVWVARNPPGFAFVEFEDPRDAEDAVRGLDGTRCCGTRVRVEMSSGRSRRGGGGRRPGPRYSRSRSRSPRRKSLGRYPRSWSRSPRRASISRYSRNRFRYLFCHRCLYKRSKLVIGKLRTSMITLMIILLKLTLSVAPLRNSPLRSPLLLLLLLLFHQPPYGCTAENFNAFPGFLNCSCSIITSSKGLCVIALRAKKHVTEAFEYHRAGNNLHSFECTGASASLQRRLQYATQLQQAAGVGTNILMKHRWQCASLESRMSRTF